MHIFCHRLHAIAVNENHDMLSHGVFCLICANVRAGEIFNFFAISNHLNVYLYLYLTREFGSQPPHVSFKLIENGERL